MALPPTILDRVETFRRNLESYLSLDYKEAQLRREFLDPLFEALGWDMQNRAGYAEAYKDVVHEDTLRISDLGTKAPDYSFRIGGTRKFFVEAKKPSVSIKDDPEPAQQLRRYSWSAKLPLGVLTDFQEFAIYDTRLKPLKDDPPHKSRVFYCRFEEYLEKWDEIAGIFSRDAVLKGSFDRYAVSMRGKRGTASVDDDFLETLNEWRLRLAKNLALRNGKLSQREINFAVQRILDRIIFLRIAEDRGIENYGQLLALTGSVQIEESPDEETEDVSVPSGDLTVAEPTTVHRPGRRTVYPRLCEIFERADFRYNSGLFHFHPDKDRDEAPDLLTLRLPIDDLVLRDIIVGLYYPESPYVFSVLSSEILGQVYEQFLGKVIRLTEGHRAVVEDKPEVRKAGGVYYTPTYIVDYIVRQTVGPLVEGKTPRQVEKLRILDPACGSGSFLLGAFQFLLDWHLRHYVDNDPQRWARQKNPPIYETAPNAFGVGCGSGNWQLTVSERKRVLTNNLYGVDIDAQAVEVTKLSLLLKVLEGEARELRGKQTEFHRVLPDLGKNIKCGNSLIGSDFYRQLALPDLDDEARYRINAFDWEHEFTDIMRAGGFDAVIGNPPYVRMEAFKSLKDYFRLQYKVHEERADLYGYFIEREHLLLRGGGRFGMIVSNKFARSNYGAPIRRFLSQHATVELIVDFAGLPVFRGATVRTLILITMRGVRAKAKTHYAPPPSKEDFVQIDRSQRRIEEHVQANGHKLPMSSLSEEGWNCANASSAELLSKVRSKGQPLGKEFSGRICMGVKSGLTEAFVIDATTRRAILKQSFEAAEIIKPFLAGKDISRYYVAKTDLHLLYTYHGVDIRRYPAVERHLRPYRNLPPKKDGKPRGLDHRATAQAWYELQQPQEKFAAYMAKPKIIFPDIATEPRFALDTTGAFGANTTYFIASDDKFLLGLLNSRVALFFFKSVCAGLEGTGKTYLRFFGQYLEGFPVVTMWAKREHDGLVAFVERMLKLHEGLAGAKTPDAQERLQREIAQTDRAIDQLVYQLYALTADEIAVLEQAIT